MHACALRSLSFGSSTSAHVQESASSSPSLMHQLHDLCILQSLSWRLLLCGKKFIRKQHLYQPLHRICRESRSEMRSHLKPQANMSVMETAVLGQAALPKAQGHDICEHAWRLAAHLSLRSVQKCLVPIPPQLRSDLCRSFCSWMIGLHLGFEDTVIALRLILMLRSCKRLDLR